MSNKILDFTLKLWNSTRRTRISPKGWSSGNAPCCTHNRESVDKRGRGGFKIIDDGSIIYHCFNCNYKTGFVPGKSLPHKFRKLLTWMGADEIDINYLVIEALRIKSLTNFVPTEKKEHEIIDFKKHELPKEAMSFEQWITFYELQGNDYPKELVRAVEYAADRFGNLSQMPSFYWTPDKNHAMNRRLIIPFTWEGEIIGYTGRAFTDVFKPKYYNDIDSDYVFNIDQLIKDSKFVLVFEGSVDALLMNGVAVLSNEVSIQQADIIEELGKQVIVVPDLSHTGIPLIKAAIKYGWHVSFPEWGPNVKDAGEAVQRYGKLFTLNSIISNIATSKLKIELNMRKLNG